MVSETIPELNQVIVTTLLTSPLALPSDAALLSSNRLLQSVEAHVTAG